MASKILVTLAPILLSGSLFSQGEEVPPDVWEGVPPSVKERLIAAKRVSGAPAIPRQNVDVRNKSTILTLEQAIQNLSDVGVKVPPGTSRRLVWFAHNVIIDGHDIKGVAAKFHLHAVLPQWVPNEFRDAVGMEMLTIQPLHEAGARPEALDSLLTDGVVNTTNENVTRPETLPSEERVRLNTALVEEQLAAVGPIRASAPKKAEAKTVKVG